MEGGILFPAIVESLKSRKDKSIAITLGTYEVSPDKAGQLFNTNGHTVTCYLSVKELITDTEKEIIDSIESPAPGKSPSQRMRNCLYILHQQKPEGYEDFNLFYLHHMEKMISEIKSKLQP